MADSRRLPGEGAIYTTADGRLRGALRVTDPRTGLQVRRFVSGRTRKDVGKKLDDLRKRIEGGTAIGAKVAVGSFLDGWLEAERSRVRLSTWRQRELHVRLYMRPAIGASPLATLNPLAVERMTSNLVASGLSARTAAAVRVTLRRALGDAVRDGLIGRNVASLARPPRVPTRSLTPGVDYLLPDDLRRLVNAARVHPLGPLVTVAATTGLRLGELLGLTRGDVDMTAGTLTVRRSWARAWTRRDGETVEGWALSEPKTVRSRRTIHLPAAAGAAIERQQEMQDAARQRLAQAHGEWQDVEGLIFTDDAGLPLSPSVVNKSHHRLLATAGLPSIPFHGLRHSAATAMLAGGVPLKVVSETLGHATITITADVYAAVIPAQRRDAADAMDRAMGGEA